MPWGQTSGTGLAGESLLSKLYTEGLRYTRCSLRGTQRKTQTQRARQ